MTEYLEPADVEDYIASAGLHFKKGGRDHLLSAPGSPPSGVRRRRHLAAGSVRDGDEFVRTVADHKMEIIDVADWIEMHTTRL